MKKYISIALLIIWMGVIYFFSSQNGTASGNLSSTLLGEIGMLLGVADIDTFVLNYGHFFRKFAHFTEYFILGVLMANACKQYTKKNVIVVVLVLCAIYASMDEIHQFFVRDRAFGFMDILLDTFGSLCGNLSFHLLYKLCFQEKKL